MLASLVLFTLTSSLVMATAMMRVAGRPMLGLGLVICWMLSLGPLVYVWMMFLFQEGYLSS